MADIQGSYVDREHDPKQAHVQGGKDVGANTGSTRRTLRLWFALCLACFVLCPVVSVMIGMRLHARPLFYQPDPSQPAFDGRTVLMDVALINARPPAQTVTIDWTFVGEENSPCSVQNLGACTDINVFFDDNLLSTDTPGKTKSSNRPTTPIFIHNASAFALNDIVADTPTFRTSLAMFSPRDRHSSLIYYPFDVYSAEIFIFAQDAQTNNTIGLKILRTRGIADGFKTHAFTRQNVTIPPGMMDIMIFLERGNLVKAFSLVVIIAIWSITMILLLVMVTSIFFGFKQSTEVLVIPVATLFAFTQLRGSMPGAPAGFGDLLDFVGILPCLAILSLSAAITLGAFILSDPSAQKNDTLSWDLLFKAFPALSPKGRKSTKDDEAAL